MCFEKELFVIEGEDPLLVSADEPLTTLSSTINELAKTPKMTFHPFSHRYEPTEYDKHIFVNEDGFLFSQGTKKYRAAWDMLSDALGKWTTVEFINGPIEKRCVSHDPDGLRYYLTDPVIFERNIVIADEESGPVAAVNLQFHVILAGSCDKPDIEEFSVCVEDPKNISLLQGVLDRLGSKICLTPTDGPVRQWESEHFKRFEDCRKEHDKMTGAFLRILNDDDEQVDIMPLHRHLPTLPYGSGLKRFISAWLEKEALSFDLGFEKWLLEGRSEEILRCFSNDHPDLDAKFKTMLRKILNKVHETGLPAQFPEWTPTYREYRENKSVLKKELEWFGKRCPGANHHEGKFCTEYSAMGGK
ncbi:MAG: hypothetical protein GX672_05155 [Synergistaceae bacterium]|nr:hypothetical protein [Synergistaceae bacterium]